MAACTNNGGSIAKRAVTAALVGVLSVGTVPMAALAEGVSDAVSPMFAEGTEFSNGTVNGLKVTYPGADGQVGGADDVAVLPSTDGNITLASNADFPLVVSIDGVTPAGQASMVPLDSNFRFRVYNADSEGNPTGSSLSGNKILDAGNYVVVVEGLAGSKYEGQLYKHAFSLKGEQLPAVTAYQNDNTSDNKFTYSGSALNINYYKSGDTSTKLVEGVDYSVSYKIGNRAVDSVTDAGTYTATLTGLGRYAGTSVQTTFTVDPFVIDTSTTGGVKVEVDPFVGEAPTQPSRVYWTDSYGQTTYLDPSLVGIAGAVSSSSSYNFNVTVDQSVLAAGNVKLGSTATTKTTYKVDSPATFMYHGKELADSYDVIISKGETFDISDIDAYVDGKKEFDVVVGNVVKCLKDGASYSLSNPELTDTSNGYGSYEVTVQVVDSATHKYAGTKTFTVNVYQGEVNADESLYVYHMSDPLKAITSYTQPYNGNSVEASHFTIGGKDAEGNTVAAADLSVTMYNADGTDITADGAANAGEYKLSVTSKKYKLYGTTELPITIHKVDLTTLEIGAAKKWNGVAGEDYVPYSTSATFTTSASAINDLDLKFTAADGKAYQLPDNVDVTVQYNHDGEWKDVGNFTTFGTGDYRLIATVAKDVASNYVLPEGQDSVTLEFTVAQQGLFKDVQPSAWYYDVVDTAFRAGYMNGTTSPEAIKDWFGNTVGYKPGSGVFNPEGTLTRGQVAAVLFNASGEHLDETKDGYDVHTGWNTGFDDVDGTQFYGEGIAWCKQNGVVNGYEDGTFRPDQAVTREEFISMLANYAKVVLGDDTVGNVSTDILAEFPDGSKVSGWAASNMAWAAENEVAGNGGTLMPTDTMTRAYCAAMLVNYLNPTA